MPLCLCNESKKVIFSTRAFFVSLQWLWLSIFSLLSVNYFAYFKLSYSVRNLRTNHLIGGVSDGVERRKAKLWEFNWGFHENWLAKSGLRCRKWCRWVVCLLLVFHPLSLYCAIRENFDVRNFSYFLFSWSDRVWICWT